MEVWPVSGGIPLNSPESVLPPLQEYKAPQVVKCSSRCIFASEAEVTQRTGREEH